MPSSAGRMRCPARNTTWPALRSSPAKRRFCPALPSAPAAMRTTFVLLAGALLHHHRVGARRHHAAGEDAHALSRADAATARTACPRTIRRRAAASSRRRSSGRRNAPRSRPSPSCRGRAPSIGETMSCGEHAAERVAHMHALDGRRPATGRCGSARAPCRPASSSDRNRRRTRLRAGFLGRSSRRAGDHSWGDSGETPEQVTACAHSRPRPTAPRRY